MKKTMFITSVIMVVVMAIALTTSSLAWFSATGATTVTTKAVTISAKTNATSGLLISKDKMAWQVTPTSDSYIDLTHGAAESYVPLVPYGDSALTGTPTGADIYQEFLEGLQQSHFIGNTVKTVGANQLFDGTPTVNAGFYEEHDLYVANSGDQSIKVSAAITITNDIGATMYVAVLARHETNAAAFRGFQQGEGNGSETQNAYEAALASYNATKNGTYELLAFAKSKDTFDTQVGRYAEGNTYFLTDANVAQATAVVPAANISAAVTGKKTSFNLAGTTIVNNVQELYGDWMQVKVLVWYSTDLSNGNSGNTNTHGDFSIVFTKESIS